jgi:hypothetical protein
MKIKYLLLVGLVAGSLIAATSVVRARSTLTAEAGTLVDTVRQATTRYKNVKDAEAAGYGLFHGCVSGPQEGAMGIHYVKGDLVGDGAIDALKPEALMYELRNGRQQLTGVEYVVLAEAWDANHEGPPMLMGQVFHYVPAPNRYRIPAFYELHVWAWKFNPRGMFVDWNPTVSCEKYSVESPAGDTPASHGSGH